MITPVIFDGPEFKPDVYDGLYVKLEGLSSDVPNLPTTVLNGSSFHAFDTGDYYKFDAENLVWREQ